MAKERFAQNLDNIEIEIPGSAQDRERAEDQRRLEEQARRRRQRQAERNWQGGVHQNFGAPVGVSGYDFGDDDLEPVGQSYHLQDYVRDQLLSVGKTKKKSVNHCEAFQANQSNFQSLNAGPIISWSLDNNYQPFEAPEHNTRDCLDRLTMMPDLAV